MITETFLVAEKHIEELRKSPQMSISEPQALISVAEALLAIAEALNNFSEVMMVENKDQDNYNPDDSDIYN